jgi:hypothetical protein
MPSQVVPDEFEDAALPYEQEVPDAVEPVRCVLVLVGIHVALGAHRAFAIHLGRRG